MNNGIKVMNNDEIRDFCIKKDLKIFELERELNDCYRGIEQLNNIIHKAILELEKYENDNEANRYAPVKETLDILRGDKE